MNSSNMRERRARSSGRMPPWTIGLLAALAASGCGRINFGAMDGSSPVDAASDTTVDARPMVDLRCGALAPVSPMAPSPGIIEPALRTDGLTVLSRFSHMDFQATRMTVDDPFSDWAVTTSISSIAEDPSFIEYEGVELGFGARRSGDDPRYLTICRPPFDAGDCDALSVFDDGVLMADDLDGPSAAIRAGELFMAFNRQTAVYIARPRAVDLLEWDATLVDLGPGVFGDPTVTKDAAILVAADTADALYVAAWDAAAGTFVEPHLIVGTEGESPEIGVESPSGFELFVARDSRGVDEVHRTSCTF